MEVTQENTVQKNTEMNTEDGRIASGAGSSFHLRRLNAGDIWPMVSVLDKIGVNSIARMDTVQQMFFGTHQKQEGTEKQDTVEEKDLSRLYLEGMTDIISLILAKLPFCRQEIYELLSRVSGMDAEQLDSMDLLDFTEMLEAFFRKEELADFFKAVSKFIR